MADPAKEVARPAVFRKRVKVLRVVEGDSEGFFVRDEVLDEQHTFEPWQFFVLEVLFGCEDFEKLQSVFQDRFGRALSEGELDSLFALVEKHKWFSLAGMDHPMVVASRRRAEGKSSPKPAVVKPARTPPESANGQAVAEDKKPLPPGVQDALGLDDATKKRIWKLFDPRGLLKLTHPVVWPLRRAMYLLPLLLVLGIGIVINYAGELENAFDARHQDVPLLTHLLISMVTDNLLAMWALAMVAYHYRATVDGFGIVLHFWILPRFIVRIGHVRQLSRRERIWLHAAPLLTRLTLFNVGILTWFAFRSTKPIPAAFGLTLATASALSLAITGNPLIKSNAYYLLAAFLDEPYLRGRSTRALIDKFRGAAYQKADRKILAAYALASAVFLLVAFVVILFLLDRYLQFYLGGPGLVVLIVLTAVLVWIMIGKFKKLNEGFRRTTQFEQWRERVIPQSTTRLGEQKKSTSVASYFMWASVPVLAAAMFLPYSYEVGGSFVVLPQQTQNVTSELSGIVEEIHFDGGEILTAGTVVGRLSSADDEVQVKTLEAKIAEQEAVIAELRSRPLPEEVRLAEQNLATEETRARLSLEELQRMEDLHAATVAEVQLAQTKVELAERGLTTALTRADFSREKLERTEWLRAQDAISLEDLEEARREHELDVDRVEEARSNLEVLEADLKLAQDDSYDELADMRREHEVNVQQVEEERANLELAKVGAKPEEITAAEEKLQGWKDERDYYLDRIEKSNYSMPFDGTLVATRLKERIGSYVDKGEILAAAESTAQMIVQIDLPESDIGAVQKGASVRARLPAYYDEDFVGEVAVIDSTVTELELGPVVRITALVPNPDGRLKSGMSGYAKIRSEELPVWKVLSLGIVRFFKVEVWSWLP